MLIKFLKSWENAAQVSNINSAFEQTGFPKYQIEGDDEKMFYLKADIINAIRLQGYETSPVVHGNELKQHIMVHKF